ncbi:MAG: phosphate acetyltransferase, partial [Candidatus Zixiibacteriota bacterium]
MSAISDIKAKAKAKKRRVVLPEGTEPRMIDATARIIEEGIASVTLVGAEEEIRKLASEQGVDLNSATIVDPTKSPDFDSYVADFMEIRKAKGITKEQAQEAIQQSLYFGAMMVRHDKADASVAGSINTTGNVLRAAIQVLGLKEGIRAVSSSFIMTIPEYRG